MEARSKITPLDVASDCLLLRSRRLARLVTRIYAEELAPHGLDVGPFTLLAALSVKPGARSADLSALLDLERSAVSRELAHLVREGLVVAEPIDGRSASLRPTPAGRARFEAALPAWERAQERAHALLGDVAPALKALFASGGPGCTPSC